MPSVGKSTLANKLSLEFRINSIGGGDALKEIASKRGISTEGADWWDTRSGMAFLAERFKDHSLDRQVDDLKAGQCGNYQLYATLASEGML